MKKSMDKTETILGAVIPKAVISKVKVCYQEAAWSWGISRSQLYLLAIEGPLPCNNNF